MRIHIGWDGSDILPEKTIIVWTFEESWDWNDFREADNLAYQMAVEMPHTVHSLIDFRRSKSIPRSGAISYFSRSILKAPPNRGTVVVVGAPRIIHALEKTLRTLMPKATDQYTLVDTMEEAYQLLKESPLT